MSPQQQAVDRLSRLPWWFLIIVIGALLLGWQFSTQENFAVILERLMNGLGVTVFASLIAYAGALAIGLLAGLGRVSKNPFVYNIATLYVQIIRGVPMLVQLIFNAFVITPALIGLINRAGALISPDNVLTQLSVQDISFLARAIIGLAIAYGGFEAETIRAGIESIGKGQMEAARSLGLSHLQAMRLVILPQAFRRVLPTLGNDFISMVKDSSLVGILGVRDITREGSIYAAASFRYLEVFSTVAFVYLILTFVLALGVRWLENRLGTGRT
jgi:polar amino acid transport system permease protein